MTVRTLVMALSAAIFMNVGSPEVQAASGNDLVGEGVYGAVNRGAAAAAAANSRTTLGTSSWGVGSPGRRSGAGYSVTSELTFSCDRADDTGHDRSGIAWRSAGHCDATHIMLQRCSTLAEQGVACTTADWSAPQNIGNGETRTIVESTITAHCTPTRCTLSFDRFGSMTRDTMTLRGQGRNALAASQARGGRVAGVAITATSEDYLGYRRTSGARLSGCSDRVKDQAIATGVVIDCKGDVRAQLTFDGMECGKRCVEAQTVTSETTESCIATVPNSAQICTATYGSHQCIIEHLPGGGTASSCLDEGAPSAGCADTYPTCDIDRVMDTQLCHYDYERSVPAYQCPAGSTFEPDINRCVMEPTVTCPAGSHYPRTGAKCIPDDLLVLPTETAPWQCPAGYSDAVPGGGPWWWGDTPSRCVTSPIHIPTGGEGGFRRSCPAPGYLYEYWEGSGETGGDHYICVTEKSCPAGTFYPGSGDVCVSYENVDVTQFPLATRTCPADFILNTNYSLAEYRCEKPPESVGNDTLPDYYYNQCPAGYLLEPVTGKCRLADLVCQNPAALTGSGQPAVRVTRALVITPGEGIKPLAHGWNADGTELSVHYSDYNQNIKICDPDHGWRGFLIFDLPQGAEQISEFFLRHLNFDDNMVVTLNGHEIYSSGFPCDAGNGNAIDVDENLSTYLRQYNNVLIFKAYGGPSTLLLGGTIVIGRKCQVDAQYIKGLDDSVCAFTGTTGSVISHYDCGLKSTPTTNCSINFSEYKLEGRGNEQTNSDGDVIAYDEVYSTNEHTIESSCQAASSPFCNKTDVTCVDTGPHVINGVEINRKCFKTVTTFECEMGSNVAQCTNNPVPADCSLTDTTCLQTDASGNCLVEQEQYLCTGTGTVEDCTAPIASTMGCAPQVTHCEETDSAGNCLKQVTIKRCYTDQPDRCLQDASCKLNGTTCTQTDGNGLCTKQEQTYSCERLTTTCVREEAVCQHETGTLFGGKFNKVVSAAGKVNALLQMAKRDGSNFSDIRIMPGKPAQCEDDVVGDPIAAKCCDDDADDSGLLGVCNQEERELAAAKRASRTHYIGRYCSQEIDLGFTTICIEHTNNYCQFNSLLERLVHEQGRPQLAAMAGTGPTTASHDTLSFPYMADSPAAGWQATLNVNGRKVAAYTWDSRCKNPGTQGRDQNVVCPVRPVFFVASCGGLNCPANAIPEPYTAGSGSTDWTLHRFDAEQGSRAVTLGKNINAGGQCNPDVNAPGGFDTCNVEISSWAKGDAGNARFAIDISWSLFRDPGVASGWTVGVRTSGRFQFQPYQIERTHGIEMPDQIPLRVAVDGGAFQTYTIPTVIPPGGLTLPTTPSVAIYGACKPMQNWCRMKAETLVEIHAKPWCGGDCPEKSALHCEGFTVEEFMALDFSRMDLSEYTSKVSPVIPPADMFQPQIANSVAEIEQDYHSGQPRDSLGSGTDQVMTIKPTDGRAPWEATAHIARQMRTDAGLIDVRSVTITWGDGSTQTVTPATVGQTIAKHTYTAEGDRDLHVVATFHLVNGQTRRARAKLRTWTKHPPDRIAPYGGGQSGGATHRPDATPSGRSGNQAPPAHVDLSNGGAP